MSEITANLFQFSKRANTLNVNQEEMPDYNSKIKLIAEKYNEGFENFKDLFKFLLDFAIHETDFTVNQEAITLNEGEIIVTRESIDKMNVDLTGKQTQIDTLTEKVRLFQAEEDKRFGEALKASEAMENVLLVPVSPEQKELLQIIAVNRCEAGYEVDSLGTPDTADSIIRRIAFQGYNLRNEYKRFYTGL